METYIVRSVLEIVNPLFPPGIGTVCVSALPPGSCPLGEIDCDGGNDLDVGSRA